MKVSAKAEYACVAMLDLALSYGSAQPVRVKRIAEANGIPQGFLVQILLQLKAAGYVVSVRGAGGGYRLARPPETISLADVLGAIDGSRQVEYDPASSELGPALRTVRSVWPKVGAAAEQMLGELTLADLVEQAQAEISMPVVGDWI